VLRRQSGLALSALSGAVGEPLPRRAAALPLHGRRRAGAVAGLCALAIAAPARGVDAAPSAETQINRRATDPVSLTWSLQLENALNVLDFGAQGSPVQNQLKFRPTMPVWLSDNLKLIVRPTFTLVSDTPYESAAGEVARTTGVGDTTLDLGLSPRAGPYLFALGPTFTLPTANLRQTGQGKWQAGPAGVLGYKQRRWLAGVIWEQWWSFAGAADRARTSALHAQYLFSWFFDDGWSVGTAPTIKVNWLATGQKLTLPIGPSVSKVVKLGGLPIRLELRAMYVPVHPSGGESGIVELIVQPVVPSPLDRPLFGAASPASVDDD
jgi:hypothetical protein